MSSITILGYLIFLAFPNPVNTQLTDYQQKKYDEQIWRSAYFGFNEYIDLWFKGGASLSARGMAKTTPLIIAANNNKTESVKLLLDLGANIDDYDLWNYTALARSLQHPETAFVLIDRGASIHACDWKGDTVLMNAATYGVVEIIQRLLDEGARIDETNIKNGWTAIMYSASNGNTEAVRTFISKGADLQMRDTLEGKSALARAVENGHYDSAELLLEAGMDSNERDSRGSPLIVLAAKFGRTRIIDLLVKYGVDIDAAETSTGLTALMAASSKGHADSVDNLLQNNASVDLQDTLHRRWRALDYAVTSDNRNASMAAQLLIDKGADVSQRDARGRTALFQAASLSSPGMVELLLNESADPNAQDLNGATPLMSAATSRDSKKVEILLNAGSNINDTTVDGISSLMIASQTGHAPTVDLLLQNNPDINAQRNDDNTTALITAVNSGKTEIVAILSEYGADNSLRDCYNNTALEIAKMKGYRCMVELIAAFDPSIHLSTISPTVVTQYTPCLRDYDY